MTFLAPWAMALGVLGAAATVVLHLVARHRPAAYLLPTARFVPERQSLVARVASRPRDLLLLACRVLLLLCAGAAFAQPVLAPTRAGRARIVLLDRSALVADPGDAWRRARTLAKGVTASSIITFDTIASVVEQGAPLDSAMQSTGAASARAGSISAALVAARRASGGLAGRADSVELVLVSPVAAIEIDSATRAVRGLWPGGITVEQVAIRTDTAGSPTLERAVPFSDILGPALVRMPVGRSPRAIRLRRDPHPAAEDSAFARAGGTVVVWDSTAAPMAARGLVMGEDVLVAFVGRRGSPDGTIVRARWADGTPAAADALLGAGCIRTVGIGAPSAGDLALRPSFQRIVRGLFERCATTRAVPADSVTIAMLRGGSAAAPSSRLASDARTPSPIVPPVVPWLLATALGLALLELVLRRAPAQEEATA